MYFVFNKPYALHDFVNDTLEVAYNEAGLLQKGDENAKTKEL
jgi:hypothetical protein